MPQPSKLVIATSALQRLLKEEASYHKEQRDQEERVRRLEGGPVDENTEFTIRQEVSD
jgi:tubulin-specific chaperone A